MLRFRLEVGSSAGRLAMAIRKIRDVIRRDEIYQLSQQDTVRNAADLMKARKCGSVLVTAGDALIGIFTERDVVFRVVAEGRDPQATKLGEVMTANPVTVGPQEPAISALRLMEDSGFRHLPVVEDGRILGVVSRRDFAGEDKARLEDERRIWEKV
jgi:CBS domain-containing protein